MIYQVTMANGDGTFDVDADTAYSNSNGDFVFSRHVNRDGERVVRTDLYDDFEGMRYDSQMYLTLARGEWKVVKLAPEQGE